MTRRRSAIRSIRDLRPDPANARTHSPRNVELIAAALEEVGAARSIVIDEDGTVLAGNATLEAARTRGLTRLQIVEADGNTLIAVRRRGLTAAKKARLALYDNRTSELATWNGEALAALVDGGISLDGLWSSEELASLLSSLEAHVEAADEVEPPPDEGPCDSGPDGTLYQLGPHRLVCGDSTDPDVQALALDGAEPRLWIHDPPYDLPFGSWPLLPSIDVVAVWHRGKDAYLWMGQTFAGEEWGVHGLVFTGGVRGQHNPSLPCCMHDHVSIWRRKWWTDVHEAIDAAVIRASGCKATSDDRPMSWQEHVGGVLTGAEGMSWGKPVLENAIVMAYVPAGAAVWDPCAGSGSSLLAAAQHGRAWIGVEQQPKWCDLIRRRWTRWARSAGVDPGPGALADRAPSSPAAARSARRGTSPGARKRGS